MRDGTYEPTGYCPYCGYGIDAGVCSECGEEVTADELDAVPGRRRRRRRIRILVRWAAALFIVIGGFYHLRHINFKAKLPTSWLLMLDRCGADWASQELWSGRFCTGKLSEAEAAEFLSQHVTLSPLEATSPHPANESVCLRMSVTSTGWFQSTQWDPQIVEWNVLVNGEPETYTVESHSLSDEFWTVHLRVRLAPQTVGVHRVRLTGVCTLTTDHSWRRTHAVFCGGDRPSPRFDFSRSLELCIDARTLDDLVRSKTGAQLAEQIAGLFSLQVVRIPERRYSLLSIWCAPLPLAFAGDVRVRRSSADEAWIAVAQAVFPSNRQNAVYIDSDAWTDQGEIQSLDIVLRPNAKLALDSGFNEYFGGSLMWTAVPISPPDGDHADYSDVMTPTAVRDVVRRDTDSHGSAAEGSVSHTNN